ncbi:MAG: hypothetical protein ABI635_07495 [Actinomycetota bacterium]
MRARFATHPFRPRCLRSELERHLDRHGQVDDGVVGHALAGLLHDIDRDVCPRCQGALGTPAGRLSPGSRVTSCRCIPICERCEERETQEASIGAVYSVFDWYHDRAVRAEVERDLAQLDANERSFVVGLSDLEDRAVG